MPKHALQINKRTEVRVPRALLEHALRITFLRYGPDVATEVSLALVSNHAIAALNRLYRRVSGATDVLSFGFFSPRDKAAWRAMPRPVPWGEIVIAPAVVTARYGRQHVRAKLALVFVHGLLHTLGFDHKGGAARKRMAKAENDIVKRIPELKRIFQGRGLLSQSIAR